MNRDAYLEGIEARHQGKPINANPYRDPELWGYWRDGWIAEDRALRFG